MHTRSQIKLSSSLFIGTNPPSFKRALATREGNSSTAVIFLNFFVMSFSSSSVKCSRANDYTLVRVVSSLPRFIRGFINASAPRTAQHHSSQRTARVLRTQFILSHTSYSNKSHQHALVKSAEPPNARAEPTHSLSFLSYSGFGEKCEIYCIIFLFICNLKEHFGFGNRERESGEEKGRREN